MCGRYTLVFDGRALVSRFKLEPPDFSLTPRFNAAPSQRLPIVLNAAPKQLQLGIWGLVPAWEQKKPNPHAFINARSETVAVKPTFRRAVEQRRCLVLSDGFYEWDHASNGKVPYRITMKDGSPFAYAGIWELWKDVPTFSIITVPSDDLVARVHDRMPVMFRPEDAGQWLEKGLSLSDALKLLRPFPSEQLAMFQVTPKVNSTRYESPDAVVPLT